MSTPFFGTGTGDPTRLTRLLAFQSADGIPTEDSAMVPFKGYGGALSANPSFIEAQRINQLPMRKRKMSGKLDFSGQSLAMGDLDTANHAQLMLWLSLLQGYTLATADGHTRWRISQQQAVESGGVRVSKKLCYVNDTDKGIPARFVDLMATGAEVALTPRSNASVTFDVQNGKMDHWGTPAVTGTGVVLPILRHYTTDNWAADATDADAYVKIISDTATAVTFQFKIASAGTYSGNQVATKGQWKYVYTGTSSTVPHGNRGQQTQVYFPVGSDNSFVDADVWIFPKRRTLTVVDSDYPTPYPISEIQCRFFIDEEEIVVDSGVTLSISVDSPETRYGVGGEQPGGTDRKGQQTVTVSLDRRLVDLTLQKKLLNRQTASLVIEAIGDVIVGTSTNYFGAIFVMPELTLEGPSHDAEEGATNYNETITLVAGQPDAGVQFSTVASIAAITDFEAELEIVVDTDLTVSDLLGL